MCVCNIKCRKLILPENRLDRSVKNALFGSVERHVLAIELIGKVTGNASEMTSKWVGNNSQRTVGV